MYKDFMKLDDEFAIELDAYSFSLVRKYVSTKLWRKTGEEVTKEREERWWFPKIEMCIEQYVIEVARISDDIKEYVEVLKKIEAKLDDIPKLRMVDGNLQIVRSLAEIEEEG